jgi:hypothetical protein
LARPPLVVEQQRRVGADGAQLVERLADLPLARNLVGGSGDAARASASA